MLGDIGPLGVNSQARELHIDEAHVEGRVMDDQFRAFDEFEEAVGDLGEAWLVGDELVGDAVDRDGTLVDLPIRIEIDMEMPPGQTPANDFHSPDLDDPMPIGHRHAGGFGIQHYVSHRYLSPC